MKMRKLVVIIILFLFLLLGFFWVRGIWLKRPHGKLINPLVLPTAKPTEKIVYKNYINQKLGISVEYPASWEEPVVYPQSLRTEVHFFNDDLVVFLGKIWRQEKQKLITYEDYVAEFKRDTGVEGEEVEIAGIIGRKYPNSLEIEGKKGFNLIFPTKKKNVILEIYYRYKPDDKQIPEILKNIFGSFVFLEKGYVEDGRG